MTSFVDDDGNELDYDGKDFALTRQTISFLDFKIRGDVSINFKISNTAHNRKVLGYFGVQQIIGPAFSGIPFSIYRNGNKIIKGNIYIYKDDGDEIDCVFLSGNSNWFNSFQFRCNEVINPDYSIDWKNNFSSVVTAYDNRNNEHGIVFPLIDYFGQGLRGQADVGQTIQQEAGGGLGTGPNAIPSLYPCLYIHTLVQEIFKKSGVNLTGDLLNDAVYQSLIVTSDGPELTNPETNERIYIKSNGSPAAINSLITIGAIAPSIKAIDLIKYLCIPFGCIPTFDVESNTLTLSKSKSIGFDDAQDWSDYFQEYEVQYDKLKSKYYIKNKQGSEFDEYNKINDPDYGDLLIETGKENSGEETVYQSPFYASAWNINSDNGALMALPYVGFFDLSVKFILSYSSVTKPTNTSIRFSGSTNEDALDSTQRIIVEVVDDNKKYSGFYYADVGMGGGTFSIDVITQSSLSTIGPINYFTTTSTGIVRVYSLSPQSKQYVLRCKPNVSVSSFSIWGELQYTSTAIRATTCSIAWFSKKQSYPNLNNETGISYGEINIDGFDDINMGETYLSNIQDMLKNAPIRAVFKLPEAVFANFAHTKWVYIKTAKLSGYFYVYKIENYTDSETNVKVDMLRIK